MSDILMQKGTALWLAKKTNLTNEQIADFCNMHEIEINAYRKGLSNNIIEVNPIDSFVLSKEMIEECEQDKNKKLEDFEKNSLIKKTRKTLNYSKRHEIVNAILWVVKNHPAASSDKICKFLKISIKLVDSVKNKTIKDYDLITPRHPVGMDLCKQEDLDLFINSLNQ